TTPDPSYYRRRGSPLYIAETNPINLVIPPNPGSDNMHKLLALFAFAFLLSSCAERSQMPAKGFEGTITETIQIPGIGDMMRAKPDSSGVEESAPGFNAGALANLQMKMYVRENKVAYDISMLGGLISMRSIIDRNNR